MFLGREGNGCCAGAESTSVIVTQAHKHDKGSLLENVVLAVAATGNEALRVSSCWVSRQLGIIPLWDHFRT